MTAAAFDAKSVTGQNFNAASTVTVSHTVGASGTVLFVIVAYFSTSPTVGQCTGVTYNGVLMTPIGAATPDSGQDKCEIYGLAGPATGTHNIIASFQSTANDGSVYGVSFSGTATTGTPWADFTSLSANTGANSSISVPNNTANDGLIDAVCTAGAANPAMVAQTNRTLGNNGNANGNAEGFSYLAPGPAGSQTMNWTFASVAHVQAGVRVLGTSATFTVSGGPILAGLTIAGALAETYAATAAVIIQGLAIGGTLVETYACSGAVILPGLSVAGTLVGPVAPATLQGAIVLSGPSVFGALYTLDPTPQLGAVASLAAPALGAMAASTADLLVLVAASSSPALASASPPGAPMLSPTAVTAPPVLV